MHNYLRFQLRRTSRSLALILGSLVCGLMPGSMMHGEVKKVNLVSVAREITKGVGTLQKTVTSGDKAQVLVFSEYHTSRVGQVQIAAMLLRLRDRYGVNTVALEGKIKTPKPIDVGWFHHAAAGQAKMEKEDVGVRMLAEGEISSAEFMAMEFPDVQVWGIESAEQYNRGLEVKGNPELDYLRAIAERTIKAEDGRRIERLVNEKKMKEAYELMLSSDPWVKKQFDALKSRQTTSSEEMMAHIREVQAKAKSVGADVSADAKREMGNVLGFYQTASMRSDTMVGNALALATGTGAPIAMIIGAAHTERVAELLGKGGASYALIQPIDLNPPYANLTFAQFERKGKGGFVHDSKGTLGRILNPQRKPSPVVERASVHGYASMNMASMLIAKASRLHKKPEDVLPMIANLPGFRVDKGSFEMDGYDVIFRAWVTTDTGEKEVWARVGTTPPRPPATLEGKLLDAEGLLKTAGAGGSGNGGDGGHSGSKGLSGDPDPNRKDGKGAGKKSGNGGGRDDGGDHPRDSKKADDEGPGDAKRGEIIISKTSRETLAVFGSSREEVRAARQISY